MIRTLIQNSIRLVPWRVRAAIKRIPVVASIQRSMLANFLEGHEFVHVVDAGPAKGLRYPVILPDDKGVWTGTYELDFVQQLAASVKPGSVCFDVGGWRGYCGGVMAMQGASKVAIFEPLPENGQRIKRLIELNGNLPIELVPAAAGETDGKATFTIMSATSMGKLTTSTFQSDVSSGNAIEVSVVSLDNWCAKHQCAYPKTMKIDVEGAEVFVLKGAEKILRESKPVLFIEAHSRDLAREVVAYLQQFGYTTKTLETGRAPDGKTEPEVCHVMAVA